MSLGLAIFILGILAMMIWSPGFRWTVFGAVALVVCVLIPVLLICTSDQQFHRFWFDWLAIGITAGSAVLQRGKASVRAIEQAFGRPFLAKKGGD